MAACIPKKVVEDLIRKIAKQEEIKRARDARINIWDITDEDVNNMLNDGHTGKIEAGKLNSNDIKNKLDNLLKYSRETTKQFIKNKLNQGGKGARLRAIALDTIMEEMKGEVDKAHRDGVALSKLNSNGHTPDLPLHRLAATIGRKLLYLKGYTVTKFKKDEAAGEAIEAIFYDFGMKAILEMEEQGFLSIANEDANTIKDYLDTIQDNMPTKQSERVTTDNPAISLNLEAFGIEFKENGEPKNNASKEALKHFTDRPNANLKSHPLGEIVQVIKAVNLLSQPAYITLPAFDKADAKPTKGKMHIDDVYDRDATLDRVTREIQDHPLYIDETIGEFMDMLNDAVEKGAESGSAIMRDLLVNQPGHMQGLFRQNLDTRAVSQKESIKGRNISSSKPFDDMVEYWKFFAGKGKKIFLSMFAGRNGRQYYDNSVGNPQTSKIMRHSYAVKPYQIKHGSKEHAFFVGKIAHLLDLDPDYVLGKAAPDEQMQKMNDALKFFDQFVKADTLHKKSVALAKLRRISPSMDYAELLSTMKAARDIRAAFEGKSDITTTYMASSDATASGGTLTLLQALGTSPEIVQLLQEMGILGDLKGKDRKTKDIYKLLEREMNAFMKEVDSENVELVVENPEKARDVMKLVSKMLFKDIRDMAKKPTMTFIYGQGREGAARAIAKDMGDRLIEKIKAKEFGVLDILNKILPDDAPKYTKDNIDSFLDDPNAMMDLIDGFVEAGMPHIMYDTLKGAIENKYLKPWKDRGAAIFQLIKRYPKLLQMKVLPASAVREMYKRGEPITKETLKKHGVPLSKIFSVRHDTYGSPVLTQEEKLTETVMTVSQIHTEDTAAAFRSLDGLPTKHDSGVIIVHDDIRGSVPLVMEAEGSYVNEVFNLANEYDIHEQVLQAAKAYDPDIAQDPDWIKYDKQVQESIAAKQELLKGFNHETDTIIGDTLPAVDFGADTATDTTTTSTRPDAPTVGLEALAGDSSIVSSFLESSNKAKVESGTEAKFDPQTDTITLPEGVKQKEAVELAEHEIVHSWTAAAIQKYYQDGGAEALGYKDTKQAQLDLGYVEKALGKLIKMDSRTLPDNQAAAVSRIQSVALGGNDMPTGMAELLAVLAAEPQVADALYSALNDKGNLKSVIERIMKRVREVLSKVTFQDFQDNNIDVEKLYSAVNNVVAEGKTMREQNAEVALELQKGFGNLYHTTPAADERIGKGFSRYVDTANDAVARMILDPTITRTGTTLSKINDFLKTHAPVYKKAANKIGAIYDENTEVGQLIHTITNANINKEIKNTILSAFAKVRAEKTAITDTELNKFSKETQKLNAEQKKAFYDFTHRMPIHDVWMLKMESVTDFKAEAKGLAVKFTGDELKALDAIVEMRLTGKPQRGTKYSVSQIFNPKKGKGPDARKYIVAKTISEIGQDKWNDFTANKNLFKLTGEVALANAVLNNQQKNPKIGDPLVDDWPEKPVDVRAVMEKDMWKYEDKEKGGWTVYRAPTSKAPGIVYKRTIDSTYMEGAFSDIKFTSTDIDVPAEMRSMEGVVKTTDGYKFILDNDAKEALGIFNNAEQGLVRSMTHAMAIQDSQNIRDKLLERDTYRNLDDTKPELIVQMINDKNTDHPWFLGGRVKYSDLPPKVQAKYKPVGGQLSDVEGFNDNIKFVRKDIEHWLIGKTERSLFNDPKWQWATRITKDLVAGAKIGMVILNPLKIAKDNMSNVAYLAVRGVDPLFIQKNYREIAAQYHDYQREANKLHHMRVRAIAAPEKSSFKKKVKQMEEALKKHPANGFVERGFVNSLGSDIVLRAGDPSSGLKSDMDAVLNTLLKSDNGELNAAGRQLMKMANWNIGLDQFLEIWAKVPGAVKAGKGTEAELLKTARRLKNIKTEDDAVSYMHQYLNSPDSEFVKMGTYFTDLSDILAKETLYRNLVAKGVSPKKAEIDVIDSFPNYNENLPTKVKQLSDVGILMFPSFWLRIQRAIYRVIHDQPINFAAEMTIEQGLGIDAENIWDANIWNKATSEYGLLHNPWSHIGWQSLFPVHAV